jgi:Transposase, Mutator family
MAAALPRHAQLPVHHPRRDRSRRISRHVGPDRPVPARGPGPARRLSVDTRRLTCSHQFPCQARRATTTQLRGACPADCVNEKHDPAGRGSGNSRNGSTGKTLLTDVGAVDLAVPRDRNGSLDPKIVRKARLGWNRGRAKAHSLASFCYARESRVSWPQSERTLMSSLAVVRSALTPARRSLSVWRHLHELSGWPMRRSSPSAGTTVICPPRRGRRHPGWSFGVAHPAVRWCFRASSRSSQSLASAARNCCASWTGADRRR